MNWNRNPKQKPATKPKAETEINLADAAADLAADLADVAADLADVASAKSAAKFSFRPKKNLPLWFWFLFQVRFWFRLWIRVQFRFWVWCLYVNGL